LSIASDLSRLQTAKANLKTSIGNKGVTVPDEAKMDSYSGYIDQISSGGATPEKGFLPTAWDENGYVTEGALYGMTSVPDYFFYNSSSGGHFKKMTLTSLPSEITSIGIAAFLYASNLTLTSLPIGTTSIGTNAFKGCTALSKIWIPASCTTISTSSYSYAPFYQCSSSLILYCETDSKPDGWGTYWNYYSSSGTLTVVWGVSKEEFEAL